jgi:hypothetical protein
VVLKLRKKLTDRPNQHHPKGKIMTPETPPPPPRLIIILTESILTPLLMVRPISIIYVVTGFFCNNCDNQNYLSVLLFFSLSSLSVRDSEMKVKITNTLFFLESI